MAPAEETGNGLGEAVDSSNFGFLASHDQQLTILGGLAERYFPSDPSTTIVKLRQFAELMAKLIAAHHATYRDARETFEETLRRLSYDRLIPREIADIFHALRKAGNSAVHEATGDHATALTTLKFARSLGIWFHETYGRAENFKAGPFIPPRQPADATTALREEIERLKRLVVDTEDNATRARLDAEAHAQAREALEIRYQREAEDRIAWERIAQDLDTEKAQIESKLVALQAESAAAPRAEVAHLVEKGEKAAAKIDLDEAETRALIDQQLRDRGWDANTVDLRYSNGTRPAKGRNLAIAEWPVTKGRADYALFAGTTLIGMVEAKRKRKNVSAAIDQAERYAVDVQDSVDFTYAGGPWGAYKVPYVFAANGRSYLKQLETESGIWFRDVRRSANHRRALVDWPTPQGLMGLLEVDKDAANATLEAQPFIFGFPLRHYQESAIRAVEAALSAEQRSILVAMATGTGKTKLSIAMLYRLLSAKRFQRICFVVDRSALGDQTAGEFSTTKVVSGKTFAEIFGLKGLKDVTPDTETKVHICTIQGLVKRVLFSADGSSIPPIDQYDLMVIDECHRGYLLDREMSDAELSFRGQEDYISKYRRVLDYFDAVKIGLTATPALHTTDIFGAPVFTYSYREAVVDGFLIDHEPPIRIETALAQSGITFAKDEALELLNTRTGEIDLAHAPDELNFEVEAFNRQVITPEFNRVIAEELARHIDPALPGKTLIFAATDAHADMVVSAIKKAFADHYGEIDDSAVKKLTGSVDKVGTLIRSFRNDADPKIVVTVDLLTTGIDVPKITNLVFLRRVNSRILYEQMIGRATRQCPEIGKDVFRIFDAVDLYPHLQNMTDMKPVVVNPSISFTQLVQEMTTAQNNTQRDAIRDQLAVKLRRRLKKLTEAARQKFEAVAGETPEDTLQRLMDDNAPTFAGWLQDRAAIGPVLDWQADGNRQNFLPVSHHADHIVDVSRGYGDAAKPEDFLESFATFVRDNLNTLSALKLVVQRPRDLTRADLKALRLALDARGFSDANLRRAWSDARNEEIAASIIGFIRQAALGDALVPYETRVHDAMRTILASRTWSDPQKLWLRRIGDQILREIVVDRAAIDREPFSSDGGFKRLNKVFEGELENLLGKINEELWKKTA
ncbi:type I restriction-modification system endonuclease [Asaia sp. As-1742]|uniref:type I restriction-modification system endonuclease n=1 Tax=Asaia sp. As-1742 TaxID=2608325 RepID=UPI0014232AB1|nr:type I restriction-modification system endonuclease [Asaia sp. As-1742]NIE79654.1 type I restriction-modification system endonuclease [Asaia sp. As-1742]